MIYKTNWLAGLLGPMLVAFASTASAIPTNLAASQNHTIFIDNGAVFGMGSNRYGEIAPATGTEHRTPYFTGVMNAKTVATNQWRTAFLLNDGTATLAGMDYTTYAGAVKPFPATNISDIALTQRDAFYVVNGQVFRWAASGAVTMIDGASNVKHIAAGNGHLVMLFNDGTVGTFGTNTAGQVGNGSTAAATMLVKLAGVANIVEISAGANSTVLRRGDGAIIAFGKNIGAELGITPKMNVLVPTVVPNLTGVKKLMPGLTHTAVLKTDGTVWASGWHNYISASPWLYNVSETFTQLPIGLASDAVVGGDQTLIIRPNTLGQLNGWGGNLAGKLGDGTNLERHELTTAFFTPIAPPPPAVTTSPFSVVAATTATKTQCNNGWGNGTQCTPGNSVNNQAANNQSGKTTPIKK